MPVIAARRPRSRRASASIGLVLASACIAAAVSPPSRATRPQVRLSGGGTAYLVEATGARLNRRVLGPVTHRVAGVPARPVDSFVWNGAGSEPIDGEIVLELDPAGDAGTILATWTDRNGSWTYRQSVFRHPHHAAGVRIGRSVARIETRIKDPVVANVHLHGDTGAGPPVLPTVFAYLASWGPAEVLLDGVPFANPYELPAPLWSGHLMVTEGTRGDDGTVRTVDGAIYDPSWGGEGRTDPEDLEVHLVFHDERFPVVPDNVPPLYEFFYHLVFEDVAVRMIQADRSSTTGISGPRTPPR